MAFAWPLFLKGHTCSFSFSFLGWHFGECARMELRGESTATGDPPHPLPTPAFQGKAMAHVAERAWVHSASVGQQV